MVLLTGWNRLSNPISKTDYHMCGLDELVLFIAHYFPTIKLCFSILLFTATQRYGSGIKHRVKWKEQEMAFLWPTRQQESTNHGYSYWMISCAFRSPEKKFSALPCPPQLSNDNFFFPMVITTSLLGLGACHILDSFTGAIVSSSQRVWKSLESIYTNRY